MENTKSPAMLNKHLTYYSLVISIFLSLAGCQKESPSIPPLVRTGQVTKVDNFSVKVFGEVTTDGNAKVTERGIVFGSSPNLTSSNSKVTAGTGIGPFEVTLPNLSPGTKYYFNAYAVNKAGASFGSEAAFEVAAILPQVTGTAITSVGMNTATAGGEILSDGGSPILIRGICYSTSPEPTTSSNVKTSGSGLGSFSVSLTGLNDLTTYYVRAFATSNVGTAYGQQFTFTTTGLYTPGAGVKDADGNQYQTIIINGQEWMKKNLGTHKYRNGDPIDYALDAAVWRDKTTGAYVEVGYNSSHGPSNDYGALYNWYAVADPRGLCPSGYHVASDEDWTKLTDFLGGINNDPGAASNLKATGTDYWQSPNLGATNKSGFTAIPGGMRDFTFGTYYWIDQNGFWWTSTETYANSPDARNRVLYSNFNVGDRSTSHKSNGLSVRCLKD